MRLAAAIAVLAVAFPAALYVHERSTVRCAKLSFRTICDAAHHSSWQDPVAVLIALGGLALAVVVVAKPRSRAAP